jgi:hypothetical protein
MRTARRATALVPLAISIAVLTAVGQSPAAARGPAAAQVWDLASDFRIAPDQANPNPDAYGHRRVWFFLEGARPRGGQKDTKLATFVPDAFGVQGLEQWVGDFVSTGPLDRLPAVGINATGSDQHPEAIVWPAGTIRVHPLSDKSVLVAWRSPVSGAVHVDAQFSDLDSSCGNGIAWQLDQGRSTLASGRLPNGGSPQSASVDASVERGTSLYAVVDSVGEDGCDSTGLSFTVQTQ